MKKQKIALFHPWLKSKGGAEKVVLELLKNSKYQIEAYTWIYDKKNTFDEFSKFDIKVIAPKFSQKFSRKKIARGLFLLVSLFNKIPLKNYEKFIISTSGVGEFITFRNYKKGETYAYIHTPLREADDEIIQWNLKNRKKKRISEKFYLMSVKIYKVLEKIAWKRIDHLIFNSQLSKARASKRNLINNKPYFIVNPPINLPKKAKIRKGDYFLYVSRINPPKRQNELINAFNKTNLKYPKIKLILVGNIEDEKYFKKIKKNSNKSISIKSNLSNGELEELYQNCLAGFFLGYQEDFGIVPLEVLLRNKPLIAPDKGGYLELVKDHPKFYPIKESPEKERLEKEIEKALKTFLEDKKKLKNKKIILKDFTKEIEKILKSTK